MSEDFVVDLVLTGILLVIASFVFSSLWFALTVDKDEKSKHS